jgi:AcrR family transcriptional regulator
MANREEKRAAILAAALSLFADKGFHGSNVPQIAERAGISVGTLYHYFPSKEAVVNDLYQQVQAEMTHALWGGIHPETPPPETFRRYWQGGAGYALAHPEAFQFLQLHHHEPYLDEANRALEAQARALEHDLFEAGRQQKILKLLPDPILSAFVGGALVALVKAAWAGQIELTPDMVDEAAARCWAAIRQTEPERKEWFMQPLHLKGERGHISIVPEVTTVTGPDEYRADLELVNWNHRATGKVWIRTDEMARFMAELRECYAKVAGRASLRSTDGSLTLEVEVVDRRGTVSIRGAFTDGTSNLQVRIESDQSFLGQALEA